MTWLILHRKPGSRNVFRKIDTTHPVLPKNISGVMTCLYQRHFAYTENVFRKSDRTQVLRSTGWYQFFGIYFGTQAFYEESSKSWTLKANIFSSEKLIAPPSAPYKLREAMGGTLSVRKTRTIALDHSLLLF